ncbi:MazG-like family protein [Actinomadura harenae]|uniref:NTP pyrophosphohydrolase MazG putative catalytic core domain-containing protein n=1 Tax=Actinomadura harenae TaxID=2483351 RepID=A0A3M2M0R1_9ACTN|nr:MazG-like family protein [Actinomadura harenae]RMI43279.1 hypothetical protein EBO15_16465 [Actinomadura harenae]
MTAATGNSTTTSAAPVAAPGDRGQGAMTLAELGRWAGRQSTRLAAKFDLGDSEQDRAFILLAQAAKLGEEAGELQREVLGFVRYQRAEKLDGFTQQSAADEIADVIICAAILAARMGVDVEDAVRQKVARVSL